MYVLRRVFVKNCMHDICVCACDMCEGMYDMYMLCAYVMYVSLSCMCVCYVECFVVCMLQKLRMLCMYVRTVYMYVCNVLLWYVRMYLCVL